LCLGLMVDWLACLLEAKVVDNFHKISETIGHEGRAVDWIWSIVDPLSVTLQWCLGCMQLTSAGNPTIMSHVLQAESHYGKSKLWIQGDHLSGKPDNVM